MKNKKGYTQLKSVRAYLTQDEIIICGIPDEFLDIYNQEGNHNCDAMGCGQDHIIARFPRPEDLETISDICHRTYQQMCGICNDWDCGDCTHPEKL